VESVVAVPVIDFLPAVPFAFQRLHLVARPHASEKACMDAWLCP
jgi:hypothetical protein